MCSPSWAAKESAEMKMLKKKSLIEVREELKNQFKYYSECERCGIALFKKRAKDVSDRIISLDEEIEKLMGE
jgi:hypothetical protein